MATRDDSPEKREVRCEACRKLLFEIRFNMRSDDDWSEITIVCPRCKKRQIARFCCDQPLESEKGKLYN